jgi:hypothetical protein
VCTEQSIFLLPVKPSKMPRCFFFAELRLPRSPISPVQTGANVIFGSGPSLIGSVLATEHPLRTRQELQERKQNSGNLGSSRSATGVSILPGSTKIPLRLSGRWSCGVLTDFGSRSYLPSCQIQGCVDSSGAPSLSIRRGTFGVGKLRGLDRLDN